MSKYGLDQFYTKKDVVLNCLSFLNLSEYDVILEPSAGDGAFHDEAVHDFKLAYDIEPKKPYILKQDYLDLDTSFLRDKKVLVYGNPPFGRNSSLALKFIKKSSEFAHTIAFVLPKGFKKKSMLDKIPMNFEIIDLIDLDNNTFIYQGKDFNVPCVWIVLKKSDNLRTKEVKLKPQFFQFVKKEMANFAIRRVGVNAGTPFQTNQVSEQSHYFLHVENPHFLYNKVNKHLFNFNDTTGPRSISKNEIIKIVDSIIKSSD